MPPCTVKEVEKAGELAFAAQTYHSNDNFIVQRLERKPVAKSRNECNGGVSSLQQVYYRELIHEAFKKHEQLSVATKNI